MTCNIYTHLTTEYGSKFKESLVLSSGDCFINESKLCNCLKFLRCEIECSA